MHYFEYAEKDSTLYSRSGSQNTGIDEILEVTKDTSAAGVVQGVSRILIKFDTTYISSSISSDSSLLIINILGFVPILLLFLKKDFLVNI